VPVYSGQDENAAHKLSERHYRTLKEGSAIAPEEIAESGARTIGRGRDLPPVFNDRQKRRAPGILFVSHRPGGETSWVFRPDRPNPRSEGHKYEQPCKDLGGSGNVLDILPSQRHLIEDTSVPVIFVEGTKKMLALVSALRAAGEEALVVSIVGCWNWLHDGGKPIPDMEEIPLRGRNASVMYDSDVLRKVEVQEAGKRLAEYLQDERGARAFMTFFRDAEDGSKVGADDFFAAGGTLAGLRLLTRRYDPEDFKLVRLSRDEKLAAMLADLTRTYEAMPVALQGQCTDRAAVRAMLAEVHRGSTHPEGVIVRIPSRRLALAIRRSRRAVQKSLDRLERDGYGRRIFEPKERVEKRGQAFLLYAEASEAGGRALGSHLRTATHPPQRNAPRKSNARNDENAEDGDTYANSYGGGYPARSPSAEVPELRAPKCVHTWGRREGRRIVVDSQYFYRLDKPRQEILMYLLDRGPGASAPQTDLLGRFGSPSTRMRDFRKRKLGPLMGWRYRKNKETSEASEEIVETGPPLIECVDGDVRILEEWREALEEHRASTDEDGDTRRQAERYRKQSKAYRERDKTPADEQPHDLHGKERVRRNVRKRAAEDRARWVEEQRTRVGATAATWIADELGGIAGMDYRAMRLRYEERGGDPSDLQRAVRYGPWEFYRESDGSLCVRHERRSAAG
jgi:Domain of unknown function (DUF3854)